MNLINGGLRSYQTPLAAAKLCFCYRLAFLKDDDTKPILSLLSLARIWETLDTFSLNLPREKKNLLEGAGLCAKEC